MWMLGAVLTVPMLLASGPIAGYVISRYLLVRFLGAPAWCVPVLTTLGFVASGFQVYQLIQKIQQLGPKK